MDSVDRSQLELLRVEVTGKLDRLTDAVNNQTTVNADFRSDHEKRMRSLERWKYAIPASVLLMLAAFFGGKVG